MNTAVELSEPTQQEVDELAEVITDAKLNHGISAGPWRASDRTAGYRKQPEPEPVRYGECRACEQVVPLNEHGALDDHDDKRRGRPCIGAHMVPLRMVDAPEGDEDRG